MPRVLDKAAQRPQQCSGVWGMHSRCWGSWVCPLQRKEGFGCISGCTALVGVQRRQSQAPLRGGGINIQRGKFALETNKKYLLCAQCSPGPEIQKGCAAPPWRHLKLHRARPWTTWYWPSVEQSTELETSNLINSSSLWPFGKQIPSVWGFQPQEMFYSVCHHLSWMKFLWDYGKKCHPFFHDMQRAELYIFSWRETTRLEALRSLGSRSSYIRAAVHTLLKQPELAGHNFKRYFIEKHWPPSRILKR